MEKNSRNGISSIIGRIVFVKNKNEIEAAKSLVRWQNSKAAMSGFVMEMGGLITIPVTIPTDVACVMFFRLE